IIGLEPFDLPRINVGAEHVVAGLGEAGAGNQSYVSRTNDRDVHLVYSGLGATGEDECASLGQRTGGGIEHPDHADSVGVIGPAFLLTADRPQRVLAPDA